MVVEVAFRLESDATIGIAADCHEFGFALRRTMNHPLPVERVTHRSIALRPLWSFC